MLVTRRPILMGSAKGDIAVAQKTLNVSTTGNSNTLSNYGGYSVTFTGSSFDWGLLDTFATNVRITYGGVVQRHKVVDWQGNACSVTIEFQIASDVPGNQATAARPVLEIMAHGVVCTQDTSFYLLYETFGGYDNHTWYNNDALMAGEHSVVLTGSDGARYIWASSFDPDGGANTGRLLKINPDTGEQIWAATTGAYFVAAPVMDIRGDLHCYSKRAGTSDGSELRCFKQDGTLRGGTSVYSSAAVHHDWEGLPYDPVNDIILFSRVGGGLSAVDAETYTEVWNNGNIEMSPSGGGPNVPTPIIWGDYWIVIDADARVWKLDRLTGLDPSGVGTDFLQLQEAVQDDTYCGPVWDEIRNRVYWANGGGVDGHRVYAIDLGTGDDTPVVDWFVDLLDDSHEVRRPLCLDTVNGKLIVPTRLVASPYSSKVFCLDVDNDGATLWTNETAWNNNAAIAQVLIDGDYVYAATTDYNGGGGTYRKLLVINANTGVLAASHDLIANSASCGCFAIGGGMICVGLWGLPPADSIQQQGYQMIRVRDGGNYGDRQFKADYFRTGYIGYFMSGPLVAPTTTIDTTTNWDLFSTGTVAGGSQADGIYTQQGNAVFEHRGIRSKATFGRGSGATPGFEIIYKARNWPHNITNQWGYMLTMANAGIPVEPLRIGRFDTGHNWRINHNGSDVLITTPATNNQRKFDTVVARFHGDHVNLLLNGASQYTRDDLITTHLVTGSTERKVVITSQAVIGIMRSDSIRIVQFSNPKPVVTVLS